MDAILSHLAGLHHDAIFRQVSIFQLPRPQDLLKMRAVCKAWRDTLFEYPGGVYFQDECKRLAICELLPGLSELHVINAAAGIDFGGLSSLYRLSSLKLRDLGRHSPKEQQLDLTLLPASLKVLDVSALRVDICALKHLKCLSITKLRFDSTCSTASEVYQLLQQLTLLQVSLL